MTPEPLPDHPKSGLENQPSATPGPALPSMPAPDRSGTERVARIRTAVLAVTALLLLVTIVLVLLYRPPLPQYVPVRSAAPETLATAEPTPSEPREPKPDLPRTKPDGPVEQALSALAMLDTAHRYALSRWAGAHDLLPTGTLDSTNAADAVTRFRKAAVLADSVRVLMTQARARAEEIRLASRRAEAGLGYRLSVAYTAAGRWLDMLTSEAEDQYQYLRMMEEAAAAWLEANSAGFEVKQNVANSHRRRSESRRRSLARRGGELLEATQALSPASR